MNPALWWEIFEITLGIVVCSLNAKSSGFTGSFPRGYQHGDFVGMVGGSGIIVPILAVLLFIPVFLFLFRKRSLRIWSKRLVPPPRVRAGLRLVLLAVAGIVCLVCVLILLPFARLTWEKFKLFVLIYGVCVSLLLLLSKKKTEKFRYIKWAVIVFTISLPISGSLAVMALYWTETEGCNEIHSNPRLRPVFSFCDPDWRDRILAAGEHPSSGDSIPSHARIIFPSSDLRSLYCGIGFLDFPEPTPFMKIGRESREIQHVYWLFSILDGACKPGAGRCYVTSVQKRSITEIDDLNDRLLLETRLFYYGPGFFSHVPTMTHLYIPAVMPGTFSDTSKDLQNATITEKVIVPDQLRDRLEPTSPSTSLTADHITEPPYQCLWVYDTERSEARCHPQRHHWPDMPGSVSFSKKYRALAVGAFFPAAGFYMADINDFQYDLISTGLVESLFSLNMVFGIAFADDVDELYIALPVASRILIYDMKERRVKEKIKADLGINALHYDPRRRLIYAGGYLSGILYSISVDSHSIVDRIYVGRRINSVRYSEELDLVLVACANGFWEVTPPARP